MLLTIPDVFSPERIRQIRQQLDEAEWVDGRVTAGHQSSLAKDNMQIPEGNPVAQGSRGADSANAGAEPAVHLRRAAHEGVSAAVQSLQWRPVVRHACGQRHSPCEGTSHRVRSDLSATLFFSNPDEYDGGELVVEDTYGSHSVKLPAGHMVLYPSIEPAQCAAGDARGASLVVLLDSEHGAR